jgi:hypothetical protein
MQTEVALISQIDHNNFQMFFMKKLCFVIVLQIVAFTLFAQKHDLLKIQRTIPDIPTNNMQEYQGYVIKLIQALPASDRTECYGFDILKDGRRLVHQPRNPLAFSPGGVPKKEDAYKIAEWIIREYKNTEQWQNTMPPQVANDLKIESH